jgi:hypothetical protein
MHSSILRNSKQGTGKRGSKTKVKFSVDDTAEVEHTERAVSLRSQVKKRRADNKKWKKMMTNLDEKVYTALMTPAFADLLNTYARTDRTFRSLWFLFFEVVRASIRLNLQGTTFVEQLFSLRAYGIPFLAIASIENADDRLCASRTLYSIGGVPYFRDNFFDNAISESDDDGNSAAGEHAVTAAPVVPANAVAAAPVNQVAVAPDGAVNARADDGVVENAIAPDGAVNARAGDGVPAHAVAAAPVVPANAVAVAPVVPANAVAAAPVIPANAIAAAPVVLANAIAAAPVVPANAVAAAPVIPANAVAAAPANQVAVAPDGAVNARADDGVNDATGRPKRGRED